MVSALPRRLGQAVWPVMVTALVTLAVYVSGGRLLLGAMPQFQSDIEALLSQQILGHVSVERITGSMDGFSPRLRLTELTLRNEANEEWIRLPEASLRIDPWQSIISGALRFDELTLIAPTIEWVAPGGESAPELSIGVQGILNSFTRLQIRDAEVVLGRARGTAEQAIPALAIDMDLVRDRSLRTVAVSVQHEGQTVFSAAGSGTGNPFKFSDFSAELHGQFTGKGMSIASQWFDGDVAVKGSSDFWFSVTSGIPTLTLQGQVEALSVRAGESVNLDQVVFQVEAVGPLDTADVWFSGGLLSIQDEGFQLPRMHLSRVDTGWRLLTTEWDAAAAVGVTTESGLLPAKVSDVLSSLAPKGTVESLMLAVASLEDPLASWESAAVVSDATTQPFRKVPGLAGIDASITASEDGARAWVVTNDFELQLPKVYEVPIELESVTGQLAGRWQRGALFLERGLFSASASDHDALVQVEIDIPLSKPALIPLAMRLAAAVDEAPVSARDAYIPYRLPRPAYRWLQSALPSGAVERATFLWHGGFKPFGHPGQTVQLAASLSAVELDYQAGWPPGRFDAARFVMSDRHLAAVASNGQVADSAVEAVDVQMQIGRDEIGFELNAQAAGSPTSLLSTLQQLPALAVADTVMRDLTVGGDQPIAARLALAFDLRDITDTLDVAVDVELSGARLESELLDLAATEVSGMLRYRTRTGFDSDGLKAEVFGRPVAVTMGPQLATAPDTILSAEINAEVSVIDLLAWQNIPATIPVEGTAAATVSVNVAEDISVSIRSDLQGVAVDLPLPWGKATDAKAPLQVVWQNRDWAAWEVFWFGRLNLVADVPTLGALSALVDVTPRTRPPESAAVAPAPGLTVTGFIPSLDLAEWRSIQGFDAGHDGSMSFGMHLENLNVGRLLWRGEELGRLNVSLQGAGDSIAAQFDLPWLSGAYLQARDAPVTESAAGLGAALTRNLDLAFIDLEGLPTLGKELTDPSPPNPERGIGQWIRGLPITVQAIRRGDTDLGDIALVIDYVDDQGWQFRDISGDFLGIEWQPATHIVWRDYETESTTLTLSAELNNIATSLELVGVAPILTTRSGSVDARWQWPGSPADFDLHAVSGDLHLEMRTGSFLTANAEATGAMRLLSLLNLSGLFRRANMNQLFNPGVTFDRAEGDFELGAGTMRIPEFSIEGSGGYFNFTSDIDLVTEALDGELVVTLPLVENIPWFAALAGGLPVAAGTYLFSKVFEDQVNQLSSGVYSVGGSLSEPEVVFERVFDATLRTNGNKAQEASLPDSSSSAK